jgi:hypothetical protein
MANFLTVEDSLQLAAGNLQCRHEHHVNYLTISSTSYEEASEIQRVLKEHDASLIGFYSGVDMAPFFKKRQGTGLNRSFFRVR